MPICSTAGLLHLRLRPRYGLWSTIVPPRGVGPAASSHLSANGCRQESPVAKIVPPIESEQFQVMAVTGNPGNFDNYHQRDIPGLIHIPGCSGGELGALDASPLASTWPDFQRSLELQSHPLPMGSGLWNEVWEREGVSRARPNCRRLGHSAKRRVPLNLSPERPSPGTGRSRRKRRSCGLSARGV